ncbi:hypothetical protein F2P79_018511 [Pimephales promelas]|nr:hypothetical protein F2P79_018511 [Pimephales promelas]
MSSDFRMSVPALRSRPMKKDYIATRAVNGQMLDTLGTLTVTLQLGTETWQQVFHVVREATQSVLLGWDFLVKNHALLDVSQAKLQLWDVSIPLLASEDFVPACCNVSLATNMTFPALSESVVPVRIDSPSVAQDISIRQGTHLGEFYSVTDSDVQHMKQDSSGNAVSNPRNTAPPISLSESPISEPDKEKLSSLLLEYIDIFNSAGQSRGKCTLVQHYIRTGEQAPIKCRAYRTSPEKRAEIERQVAGLLADGIIEESCSPWASPVVLVKKKCGAWRFCVDYRRLNSVTIQDSHPLHAWMIHWTHISRLQMVQHVGFF